MNILLANHHCFNFGGTENYTVDLARALKTLGHTVSIYLATRQDKMPAYQLFTKLYPDIKWYLVSPPPDNYDMMLINHNTSLRNLKNHKGYKIFTSHGLPSLEIPELGADAYVFISRELFNKYPTIKNRHIIKTGFFINDFEEFPYVEKLVNPTCLVIDYTPSSESSAYFMDTCKKLGIWSEMFNVKNIDPKGIKQLYKSFDIICATGRTALESILHGKRTIVYSHFGCDGLLETKFDQNNYSGRFTKSFGCFEVELVRTLNQSESNFRKIQNTIKDTRDIFNVAKQYLDLYNR
jgi:hypothetical protein